MALVLYAVFVSVAIAGVAYLVARMFPSQEEQDLSVEEITAFLAEQPDRAVSDNIEMAGNAALITFDDDSRAITLRHGRHLVLHRLRPSDIASIDQQGEDVVLKLHSYTKPMLMIRGATKDEVAAFLQLSSERA